MGAEKIGQEPVVSDGPDEHGSDRRPVMVGLVVFHEADQQCLNGAVISRDLAFTVAGEEVRKLLQAAEEQPVDVPVAFHPLQSGSGGRLQQRPQLGGISRTLHSAQVERSIELGAIRQEGFDPFGQERLLRGEVLVQTA